MANRTIEDVEGIGPVIGALLRKVGITDTDALLAATRRAAQRKSLAASTGLGIKQVLKLANMVDLYRINGIGSEYAQLLEAAGVDTVPELARRRPENLLQALAAANASRPMVRRLPTDGEVHDWVRQAKSLPRMLEY